METPQVPRYRPESHWPSIQGWLCGYSSTEWTSAVLVEAMFRTETLCSAVSRILQVPSPPHPNGHESIFHRSILLFTSSVTICVNQ